MIGVILAAAGSGLRLGAAVPKQFLDLDGRPIYQHSLDSLNHFADEMVIVVPEGHRERVQGELKKLPLKMTPTVVTGGPHRQESVCLGLNSLSREVEIVLIHDAARPFVTQELVARVLDGTRAGGACVPGLTPAETVKQVTRQNLVERTIDRDSLRLIQTPQGFRRHLLEEAMSRAARENFIGTDEALLVERLGRPVHVVAGDPRNIKITLPDDLVKPPNSSERLEMSLRVGLGFDFHPFVEGRKLYLGGIEFPGELGLSGHSDADALLHAVADAILGAAGLEDIGFHFPDSDPRLRGVRSAELLDRALEMVRRKGYRIENIDVVVIAEKPRIQPYSEQIKSSLSRHLGIETSAIGLKATTMERRGAVGREEGIAVQAVALLRQDEA